MARPIIILDGIIDTADANAGNRKIVSGVYWLTAPTNRIRPNNSATSIVPPDTLVAAFGISSAELAAIKAGTVVEQPFTVTFPAGQTILQIEAALQTAFTAAQTALNNSAPAIKVIGAFFDGTTWTAAP